MADKQNMVPSGLSRSNAYTEAVENISKTYLKDLLDSILGKDTVNDTANYNHPMARMERPMFNLQNDTYVPLVPASPAPMEDYMVRMKRESVSPYGFSQLPPMERPAPTKPTAYSPPASGADAMERIQAAIGSDPALGAILQRMAESNPAILQHVATALDQSTPVRAQASQDFTTQVNAMGSAAVDQLAKRNQMAYPSTDVLQDFFKRGGQ